MKRYYIYLLVLLICQTAMGQQLLTLDECRRLAVENNKQLKISNESIKKSNEEKKSARAQFFPDISFTGTYLYNQKNISLLDADKYLPIGTVMPDGSFGFTPEQINNQWVNMGGTNVPLDANGNPFNPSESPDKILWKEHAIIPKEQFEMDMQNVLLGNFSLVQPVFMGGKITAYNKIADYATQLAEASKATTMQEVLLQVEQAYWQTVSLSSKKELADRFVELLEQMNRDVEALIAEGFATKAEGLSVKVKLNEAEMDQMRDYNGLELSRMLLCQLCGLDMNESILLADENISTFPAYEYELYPGMDAVYSNRPEVRSLDLASKIYKKKEDVVRSEMLPTVAFTGNYLVSNPNAFNGLKHDFAGMWNVGVMVKVPIFHFGDKQHKVKAAKAETRIRQYELEEAKEKIELQVNQSLFKLTEAEKKLQASGKNKESADENLRYANLGFKEGVIPASNVMEAQTAWFKAQTDYLDAQIDVRMSQIQVSKASGTLGRGE
jgi:Outer membrane protein